MNTERVVISGYYRNPDPKVHEIEAQTTTYTCSTCHTKFDIPLEKQPGDWVLTGYAECPSCGELVNFRFSEPSKWGRE